ncbi:hypothetical protein PCANC_25039, partial [Puccinia coronata f. sp. avenae]
MKDIQNSTSSTTKTNTKASEVQFPCSPGYHHPKATHNECKYWKLSDKQHIAARPNSGKAHVVAAKDFPSSPKPSPEPEPEPVG